MNNFDHTYFQLDVTFFMLLLNLSNNRFPRSKMSFKFNSTLKLYNNCTQAHQYNRDAGHNKYRFYSSVQYNGTCLFVSCTLRNPRDYMKKTGGECRN